MMRSILVLVLGVFFITVEACNGERSGQQGSGGSGGGNGGTGAGGAGGSDGETFACGSTVRCRMDMEYCFGEMWNGGIRIPHQCRPLPPGCSSCACAEADAAPVSMACTGVGTSTTRLNCLDDSKGLGDGAAPSRTLIIYCLLP